MTYIELKDRYGQQQIYHVGSCRITSRGEVTPLSPIQRVTAVRGDELILEEIVSDAEHRHLTQQMETRNATLRDNNSYEQLPFIPKSEVIKTFAETPQRYRQIVFRKKKRAITIGSKTLVF